MTPEPWCLTAAHEFKRTPVVRAEGVLSLRQEKSWRPIVSVMIVGTTRSDYHEVLLGCDGQNPNLKSSIVLNNVDESTCLVIAILRRPPQANSQDDMVACAQLSLGDLLKRQLYPGDDVSFSPLIFPKKRNRNLRIRQLNSTFLTVRLHAPRALYPTPVVRGHIHVTHPRYGEGIVSLLQFVPPRKKMRLERDFYHLPTLCILVSICALTVLFFAVTLSPPPSY